MSDGAFPETPKGSPETIEALAEQLGEAADNLEQAESTLSQTARGLSGVSWSGMAEGRFTAAAGGLSGVCGGAEGALRTCSQATRKYATALATAKRVIEREREEYEDARVAETNATSAINQLGMRRMRVEPDRQGSFDDAIDDANADLESAGNRAQAALRRALRAREAFDEAQNEAIGQLQGTDSTASSVFGGPAAGISGSGFGPAFPATGTGGWGAGGGGFGVPAGGLANYTGAVPYEQLGEVDGLAKSRNDELHGQTEVSDMYVAATLVAGPMVAAGRSLLAGLASAATRSGGSAAGGAATTAGRTGASTADDAAQAAGRADARALNIEKTAELAGGYTGLPMAGEAGKILGYLSHPAVRAVWRMEGIKLKRDAQTNLATLLATREMSRGVRRGLSDDAIEALARRANVR